MTKKNYTAVVLVVDRSGSMQDIAKTTQSALEEFVNEQKALPGTLTIDTVFFDTEIENRATFVNPKRSKLDLSIEPRGMTALYDAVGLKIDSFGAALAALPEEKRPENVIFVIATDGEENASKEIDRDALASRIQHQKDVYKWNFTFIGANQDAVLTAQALNIDAHSAITFNATDAGAHNVLRSMSAYVGAARLGQQAAYTDEDRDAAVAPEKR